MGRLRVLVVDDDPLIAMGTAATLEDLGHEAIEAQSGAAALALLAAGAAIDVLLTDQAMPGMTGTDLIRRARAARPALPAILATGYATFRPPAGEGLEVLVKPFGEVQLAAALERALASGDAPAGE